MTMRYSRYLLWFAIAASLGMLAPKVAAMYTKGALLNELPFIVLLTVIICSPYLFMLRRASKIARRRTSRINYAAFSTPISLAGISLLYWLIYVIPDAQGGIAIMALVVLQWLCAGLFSIVDSVLRSRDRSQGA
jgi:hypothetical protein